MPLAFGIRNNNVKKLQEALKADSSIYPEGLVTGYFGFLTEAAIKRFQVKYNIAKSGNRGYGKFGPLTIAKMNEVLGLK